jgi:ABC-type antimicrobial peptide transport system permease subunit
MAKQLKVYKPETDDQLQLQPLSKQYLYSKFDFFTDWGKRSDIKYVQIFTGVGILLLLIACVNFINLSTARSLKRSMEVGIRKVNGASRKQLVFQFLCESVLLAGISGIIAVGILSISQPTMSQLTGSVLQFNFTGGLFLSFLILFIIVIGLFAGIYPAFILSAFKPISTLKGKTGMVTGTGFRKALVVVQFVICATMMMCILVMYQQLQFVQNKNLGFNSEQVISVNLGGALRGKMPLFKEALNKESVIAAAAPATMSLANVDNASNFEWTGMKPGEEFLITQANVDPDFIATMGMQLLTGENFKWQREEDTINNFIVNETAVKMMGFTKEGVIGKQIKFWGANGKVIGVVKDFHFKPLSAGIEPFIFRYQPFAPYFNLFVKIVPGKTAEAINQIEKCYKQFESEVPLNFTFLNDSINQLYKEDRRTASIIFLFACLTIFIGCLGLFGLTVYAAEQRVKEMGIRKVLGASVLSITRLLSGDFLKLVLVAVIMAVPFAWYTSNQWLQNYAYRIELSWKAFAMVGLVVLAIALLTISLQAIKAAMANPVKSLRTE